METRTAVVASTIVFAFACGKVNVQPDGGQMVDDAPIVDATPDATPDAPPDANPMCNGANQCVAVPAGWTGPVTYAAQSSEPPSCAAAYPTQVLAARQGLNTGTASCSCSCNAINLTCGTVTGTAYAATNCTTGQGNITMGINTCRLDATYASAGSFNFDLSSPTASCGAPNTSSNIPTPTWTTNVKVCGGATDQMPGVCGGNAICVGGGASPYGPVCVYQTGNHACPADFATTRELVYADFQDTRGCSNCTCTAQNATCTAVVTRYQNASNNCSGSTQTLNVTTAGSSCIPQGSQTSFQTTSITKNQLATCAKAGGTATGAAGPIDPTTICCR